MRDGHQHIGRRWTDGILPATIIYRVIGRGMDDLYGNVARTANFFIGDGVSGDGGT